MCFCSPALCTVKGNLHKLKVSHSHSSVQASDCRVDESSDDGVQNKGQNLQTKGDNLSNSGGTIRKKKQAHCSSDQNNVQLLVCPAGVAAAQRFCLRQTHLKGQVRDDAGHSKAHQEQVGEDEGPGGVDDLLDLFSGRAGLTRLSAGEQSTAVRPLNLPSFPSLLPSFLWCTFEPLDVTS